MGDHDEFFEKLNWFDERTVLSSRSRSTGCWPGSPTSRVKSGTVVRQTVGISNRAPEEMHLQFDHVPAPVTADEGVLQS